MIKINESVTEEQRGKMISNPTEKKVFFAVQDAVAEYGGEFSGNRSKDNEMMKKYDRYIENGNIQDLKDIAAFMFDLTGFNDFLWR